jgi:hypothetical protein
LADVQNHLEQGYFTQADMDLLGMKGFVTVAQMKGEICSLLAAHATPEAADTSVQDRLKASQAAAAEEAKVTADRAALIKGLADEQAKEKTATDFRNAVIAEGGVLQ